MCAPILQQYGNTLMKRFIFTAALLTALSFSAQASELSYSYIDAGYTIVNFDDMEVFDETINPDFDGFRASGSIGFLENYYAFGSYTSGSGNVFGYSDNDFQVSMSMDITRYIVGGGLHFPVSDTTDFIAELAYLQFDADADLYVTDYVDSVAESVSESTSGIRASIGLRGGVGEHFEWLTKANYDDSSDLGGEFSATLGAMYKFNKTWGLLADAEWGDGSAIYGFSVRASF